MANTGPLTGRSIRGYEFRDLLGEGGFGAVYSAYQTAVGRDVAVKVILPDYADQDEFIAGFEAEARFIAQLEHAYIVPLHDFWRSSGSEAEAGAGAFIVMRLLRGGSLNRLLLNGPLEPQLACRILHQIAGALYVAHRYGVVHRDVKPGNILLDDRQNAYLSDFGIAKPVGHQDHGVAGSPPYNAPEQLQGEPPAPQSDIYSLGFVLYEMLAGAHPFGRVSVTEMLLKHFTDRCPVLTRSDLSPAQQAIINNVIQRATAKKPGDRYENILDMAAEFCGALGSSASPGDFAFKIPDTSQLGMLQAQIERLYLLLEKLTDQQATALDPQVQGGYQKAISQVKTELRYRNTGLRQAEKHTAIRRTLSLSPPPHPQHKLIGTKDHLTLAKAALLEGKSVTMLGASGVGKSTLASELAHDEDVRRAFDGNIVWLSMGKSPEIPDLIGKWLEALGESADALRKLTTLESRLIKLQELIGERRCLVIVDDLWNIDDLKETLLQADIPLVYIVTTRQAAVEAALLWNTVINVSALNMNNRVALIRLLLPSVNFDDAAMDNALQNLLQSLGGIPRDLILLATRLRLAGADLERLQHEIDALIQTPADIWKAGFASLSLSVDALDEAARQAFRALALFPTGQNTFSTEAGAVVCGNRTLLYKLVDTSLLKAVNGRYALEPSFAEYAVKSIPFIDEPAVTQRFVEHFCVTVALSGAGTDKQIDYSVFEVEKHNLHLALRLAAENPVFHDMLIDATIALTPAWDARGMVMEAETHLQAALAALKARSDEGKNQRNTQLRRAKLHLSLAALYEIVGDFDTSEQYAGDGLAALDGYNDPDAERIRILLLRHLGQLNRNHEEYDEAYAKWKEALEKAIAIGDDLGISRLHNSMGALLAEVELKTRAKEAHDHFVKSVEAARRINNAIALAHALQNLGLLESDTDPVLAEKHLQESLALAKTTGHYAHISAALQALGYWEYKQKHLDKASIHYTQALELSRSARDNESAAFALLQLANVDVETAELRNREGKLQDAESGFRDAESRLDESFALAQKRGDSFLCDQVAIGVLKMGETRIVTQFMSDDLAQVWSRLSTDGLSAGLSEERMATIQNLYDRLSHPEAQKTDAARALAYFNLAIIELNEYDDKELARELFEKSLTLATKAQDLLLMERAKAELENLDAQNPD